jgi:uncharacterized membrane protein
MSANPGTTGCRTEVEPQGMKIRLIELWDRLRSSLWFLPALMVLGAAAFSQATVALDSRLDGALPDYLRWVYAGGAEGASAVLSTIAGSMITIAGVVFSLTLVALSLASSQFGPRLLRNFMRDRTNQATIGTFIATFLYCLLVLRTIRHLEADTFVPQISVTLGVMLAVVSLGVLIYFIHHMAVSIQADEIIARVAHELAEGIERLFPEHIGKSPTSPERDGTLPVDFETNSTAVRAAGDGYLGFVDADELMSIATCEDLLLQVGYRPGHYIVSDTILVRAHPSQRVDQQICERLQKAFVVGAQRTAAQDIEFSISQLVEIAVRALSPGINDPFTAVRCVDRLSSALCGLVQRQMPSPYRFDEKNQLRVIAPAIAFAALLDAGFNQIRQSASANVAVTIRLLEALTQIGHFTTEPTDRNAVLRQAQMIAGAARTAGMTEDDLRDVEERYGQLVRALQLR